MLYLSLAILLLTIWVAIFGLGRLSDISNKLKVFFLALVVTSW
jgi:hypothetical protein